MDKADVVLSITRRSLLKAGVALGATVLLPRVGAPAQTLFVRPDIHSSAGERMLALYEQAVRKMQDPAINIPPQPQSWTFQSYIHGVPADLFHPVEFDSIHNGTPELNARVELIYGQPAKGTPEADWKAAALACWATCTHGSPWFVAWHRWQLFYFEKIIRSMIGVADFALPYWNYASDQGASLQLPAAFRNPLSALYQDNRGLGYSDAAGMGNQNVPMNGVKNRDGNVDVGYLPHPQTDYGPALSANPLFPSDSDENSALPPDPAYYALGLAGRLEIQPHDMVHVNIGGAMGNIAAAATDPIFFVHHCQIDRLWAAWQSVSGNTYNWGPSPSDPTDPTQAVWENRKFSFVDENNNVVTVTALGQLDIEKMGYEYDVLPQPIIVAAARASEKRLPLSVAAMKGGEFSVGSEGGHITLAPVPEADSQMMARQRRSAQPPTLVLKDVKLLGRPPAPLHVFLNLPEGTAPALNSPFHVGVLNFFNWDTGTGGPITEMVTPEGEVKRLMPSTGEFRFSVGEVLARQKSENLWNGGPVTVTISTLGADVSKELKYVKIGQVQLVP